jgi:tetratricopeptide (TPR) repeat protein
VRNDQPSLVLGVHFGHLYSLFGELRLAYNLVPGPHKFVLPQHIYQAWTGIFVALSPYFSSEQDKVLHQHTLQGFAKELDALRQCSPADAKQIADRCLQQGKAVAQFREKVSSTLAGPSSCLMQLGWLVTRVGISANCFLEKFDWRAREVASWKALYRKKLRKFGVSLESCLREASVFDLDSLLMPAIHQTINRLSELGGLETPGTDAEIGEITRLFTFLLQGLHVKQVFFPMQPERLRRGKPTRRKDPGAPARPTEAQLLREWITASQLAAKELSSERKYLDAHRLGNYTLGQIRAFLGTSDPSYAAGLEDLAVSEYSRGDYSSAVQHYREVLGVREQAGGKDASYASTLQRLGVMWHEIGNLAEAERCCREAVALSEQLGAGRGLDYANSLNILALVLKTLGRYPEAEAHYLQALAIVRASRDRQNAAYATTLGNLAALYQSMNLFSRALPLAVQALTLGRKVWDKNDPELVRLLGSVANIHRGAGDTATAEQLLAEAVELARRTLGDCHPDYGFTLGHLAGLYQHQGRLTEARPLLEQSIAVCRVTLGSDHPDLAMSLRTLGHVHYELGDFAMALSCFEAALAICRRNLSGNHPRVALSLHSLGLLSVAMGRPALAWQQWQQAAAIDDQTLDHVFAVSAERERLRYLWEVRTHLAIVLSLLLRNFHDDSEKIGEALDLVLRRKGIAADFTLAQRGAILTGRHPHLMDRLKELGVLRRAIAELVYAEPGTPSAKARQDRYEVLVDACDGLEAQLARQVPEVRLMTHVRLAGRQAVAGALPEGTALVEIVHVPAFNLEDVPPRGDGKAARYLSLVLRAGAPDGVRLIDLGEARRIDDLIAAFRAEITGQSCDATRDVMVGPAEPEPDPPSPAGAAVRAAVWDRLIPALGECRRVFIAPDGNLSRVPVEILPTADGRRLMDDWQISYVTTGRDVLSFGARPEGAPGEAVVIADPDFDLSAAATEPGPAVVGGGARSADLTLETVSFTHLPGSRLEGERVAALLGVTAWLHDAAREGRLRSRRSPRILHLATHGFFLPDLEADEPPVGRDPQGRAGRWVQLRRESPLLRSGIALAGANTTLRGRALPADAEDGFLTAEDIGGLDLLDTELVVLSACETGLGTVLTGEGVFGLRRSFMIAGARTLILSLWKVPDLATAILMERLYENLTVRGLYRSVALRDAQLFLRDRTIGELRARWLGDSVIDILAAGNPLVRQRLEELTSQPDDVRPYRHAFYWGAFICQGFSGSMSLAPHVVEVDDNR